MREHLYIPDTQITPESPLDHLGWIGQYIVEKKPDVVVQGGDFADMESLSTYDKGKRQFAGRRYWKDIEAAHRGMDVLMGPLEAYNRKMVAQKGKQYKPELHLTLGNHEYRIQRAVDYQEELEGAIGMGDLDYGRWGFQVHDFLKPVELDGVYYAHYFANQQSGRPFSGNSIYTRMNNIGFSFTMGHQQIHLWGEKPLNNGDMVTGLVWGSCYLHDEDYRGPQANGEKRGIMVKHEVMNGTYDPMRVSLDKLCRKYEGCHLWDFMKAKYPDIYAQSTWLQFQERRFLESERRRQA